MLCATIISPVGYRIVPGPRPTTGAGTQLNPRPTGAGIKTILTSGQGFPASQHAAGGGTTGHSGCPIQTCSLLSPATPGVCRHVHPVLPWSRRIQEARIVCQALPPFATAFTLPKAATSRLSPELVFGILLAGILALAASEIMEMNARTRAAYGNGESPLMSRPPTFMEHFCFARERVFSSGLRKTLFFFVFTASIILAGGYAWKAVSGDNLPDSLYQSWSFVAAPDNREIDHPGQRAVSAMLTVLGVFSFGLLIGLLSDSFAQIIDDFKSGKSRMILHGHTLVVGWNSWVPELLNHMTVCNETEGRRVFKNVVVLGKVDKDTMDATLAESVGAGSSLDIMTRSVQHFSVYAMEQVNAVQADRIILIADVVGNDGVIQHLPILLALRDAAQKNKLAKRVVNNSMLAVLGIDASARALVQSVLKGFSVLDTSEYIARLVSKCTNQPGLSKVYKSLFEFEDTELHISAFPELQGKKYGQAWRAFPSASVCGVVHENGKVLLNPPDSYVLQPADKLVYLAKEQKAAISQAAPGATLPNLPAVSCGLLHNSDRCSPRQVLLCGWRLGVEGIIEQLIADLPPGSSITVLNRMPAEQVPQGQGSVSVKHVYGSPVDQALLKQIVAEAIPDSIVLLMDRDGYQGASPDKPSLAEDGAADAMSPGEISHEVDCQNLAALVMLDDILCAAKGLDRPNGFQGKGLPNRTVLELATRSAAGVLPPGLAIDVIVPGELIAGSIAQVAYMPRLNQVFLELFNNRGSDLSIYLDAESSLVGLTLPCTFMTIVTAVRQSCGDMVVGLLIPQLDNPSNKELLLAPRKDFVIKTLEGVDLVALSPNKYGTETSD
eukprot:jgi/Mesvir1/15728/Mv03303-RA.3